MSAADAGVALSSAAEPVAQQVAQAAAAVAPQAAPSVQLQLWLLAVLPFVVFYLVVLVRAFPWSEFWLQRKPLSCDACMTIWASLPLAIGASWFFAAGWPWVLLHMLTAPGIAVLLLQLHRWLGILELPLPPVEPPPDPAPTRPYPTLGHGRRIPKLSKLLRR